MPRLNHGTLLENIVLLEVARVLGEGAHRLELASAFAMPPLTQASHKDDEEARNSPSFNASVVEGLREGKINVGEADSYSALLRRCLVNEPGLPVVSYDAAPVGARLLDLGGPNGALLVALLRQGRETRIWSNDLDPANGARYRDAITLRHAGTECARTNEYAHALMGASDPAPGPDAFHAGAFPASVASMGAWRTRCDARIGFLDPDSFAHTGTAGPGQIDRAGHSAWLEQLHQGAPRAAGVLFFATRNMPDRPAMVAALHADAVALFPRSVVFCHEKFLVGVKLRCGEDEAVAVVRGVERAWNEWGSLVRRKAPLTSVALTKHT